MLILFPADLAHPRQPDPDYAAEAAAAAAAGFTTGLVDISRLDEPYSPAGLLRLPPIRPASPEVLYRGWMLRPAAYTQLDAALREQNLHLLTPPAAYRHCHYLPEYYAQIENQTPRSVWLPLTGEPNFAAIHALLQVFGAAPIIVKDYVKSQKHYWHEACFIPRADDRAAVERVVRRFLELQGPVLNEGLVFRAFLPIRRIGTHAQSSLPLSLEFRVFVLDGQPLTTSRYWAEGTYGAETPPWEPFAAALSRVPSRFFAVDLAQLEDRTWVIMEIGDGQVSGLNNTLTPADFFTALAARLLPTAGDG